MPSWSVPREWEGHAAFIVAGGPSVLSQNLELLRGRKVVAINSSWEKVPFADFLYFGDARWWTVNRLACSGFKGRIVTAVERNSGKNYGPSVHMLTKVGPPGLARTRDCVMQRRTSLTATINMVVHLGSKQIVLLGADGGPSQDGRTHHHKAHPWPQKAGCWDRQRDDLLTIVEPLKGLDVTVYNASPDSALTMFPIISLDEFLADEQRLVA